VLALYDDLPALVADRDAEVTGLANREFDHAGCLEIPVAGVGVSMVVRFGSGNQRLLRMAEGCDASRVRPFVAARSRRARGATGPRDAPC
jgi:hypothetical protein